MTPIVKEQSSSPPPSLSALAALPSSASSSAPSPSSPVATMSHLDRDTNNKMQQEMGSLPLSTVSTGIVAASTTAANQSSTNQGSSSSATPVSNSNFLSSIITGAVNEAFSSKKSS